MIQDRLYIGIDNGKNGAICGLKNGKIEFKNIMPLIKSTKSKDVYDFKAISGFFNLLKDSDNKDMFVVLEKNLTMPMSGRLSIESTSGCFHYFMAVLDVLKIPYIIVLPKVWQKAVFNGVVDWKDTKKASIQYASSLFPEEDFRKSNRATTIHDGLTDAVCMAKYGEINF